jgi:hypothetical protein
MLELAGFGATFTQMTHNDPLGVAQQISRSVMDEPDEEEQRPIISHTTSLSPDTQKVT